MVAPRACSVAAEVNRQFPGQDFHLLNDDAFHGAPNQLRSGVSMLGRLSRVKQTDSPRFLVNRPNRAGTGAILGGGASTARRRRPSRFSQRPARSDRLFHLPAGRPWP